ncbi:MAG: hypothetical protein P1P72_11085 [ANME-2 cluster archaeon]|nr:hypothetical protein [ANME-2 cluster archaeon]
MPSLAGGSHSRYSWCPGPEGGYAKSGVHSGSDSCPPPALVPGCGGGALDGGVG